MPVRVRNGDILTSGSGALFLTVAPDAMSELRDASSLERALGNLARQFRSRWPDAWLYVVDRLIYEQKDGSLDLFRPSGGSVLIEVEETPSCPFSAIVFLSTLTHHTSHSMRAWAQAALSRGIVEALQHGELDLAMTPPMGGWRLDLSSAFHVVVAAFRRGLTALPKSQRLDVNLYLWVNDDNLAQQLRQLLQKL